MSVNPIPEGFTTLTPHLVVDGADRAIEVYQKAFGATLTHRVCDPGGKVMNAQLKIGNCMLMLADEYPDWGSVGPNKLGGTSAYVHVYVENVDSVWDKAVAAGMEVIMPLENTFWGDRYGQLKDPFGHKWSLATRTRDMSSKEMEAAAAAMFASAGA